VLKVTLKGLLAARARLVLTAVAVMIGVALVAGTGVLAASATRSVGAGIQAASDADLYADLYLEGGLPRTAVARLAAP
jgi:hypothetical protein